MNSFAGGRNLRKLIGRWRRNTPGFVVDGIDWAVRIRKSRETPYPYFSAAECGDSKLSQPFFIIGSGRSGNTLLRKLLMESSRIVIPPEIPGLGNTIRAFAQNRSLSWDRVVRVVLDTFRRQADVDIEGNDRNGNKLTYNLFAELQLDLDELRTELVELPEYRRSMRAIVMAIYHAYAQRHFGGSDRIGDKTPWNVFHFERLQKVFPEAQYIHMLRDGRDCVASYVESLGAAKNISYVDAAFRWRDSVRKMERVEASSTGRFLELRYEDLVAAPELSTDRVLKYLEVAKSPRKGIDVESLGDAVASHHKNLGKAVNSASVGRWRSAIPKSEIGKVLRIIGPDLEKRGYSLD